MRISASYNRLYSLMDSLLNEFRHLNLNLERLLGLLMPSGLPELPSGFYAFRAYSRQNILLLKGIRRTDPVRLKDLKGINNALSLLQSNTEQFLQRLPSNDALVYGPRGTGKSSSIKALLNEYHRHGLRMIEVDRQTLFHLPEIAEVVRERDERYIIFCDDLSFEEGDKTYLQLKAILEGGLETRPDNLLVYATSNRRHLMPEKTEDNLPVLGEGELHPSETLEEKISLSDRFGLRIGLTVFDDNTYLSIVESYARARKISISTGQLKEMALQWSLSHGSFSGRTARQFIDDLEGRLKKTGIRKKSF